MPGIIEELMHGMRPTEAVPEPPMIPVQELPVDAVAPQMANADNGIYFDAGLYNSAQAQINWASQATPAIPEPFWQQGPNPQAYIQPWEIRQQIYPQAIETRLSAADVEKIAQRIITLWEERLAE